MVSVAGWRTRRVASVVQVPPKFGFAFEDGFQTAADMGAIREVDEIAGDEMVARGALLSPPQIEQQENLSAAALAFDRKTRHPALLSLPNALGRERPQHLWIVCSITSTSYCTAGSWAIPNDSMGFSIPVPSLTDGQKTRYP